VGPAAGWVRHAVWAEDEAIGLTAARASAFSVVVFGGPVTIGQLAPTEQASPLTMTRLLVGWSGIARSSGSGTGRTDG
jgi:hypothetical protein